MPKGKTIKEIVRQEKMLEKRIATLERKQHSLEKQRQRLFDRRWVLAIRQLVGKDVMIAGYSMEDDEKDLNGQSGVLRSVHRNGVCAVDYGHLGLRELHARDLMGSDLEEWRRLIDGE